MVGGCGYWPLVLALGSCSPDWDADCRDLDNWSTLCDQEYSVIVVNWLIKFNAMNEPVGSTRTLTLGIPRNTSMHTRQNAVAVAVASACSMAS